MRTQPQIGARFLGIILGVALVVAAACEGISIGGPGDGTIQGCSAGWDSNYPSQGSFSVQKPTDCPFKTNILGMRVNYAASGQVPSFTVSQFVQTDVYNWNGFWTSSNITDTWSQGFEGGQQVDIFSVSGQYTANTAGWHADGTGFDSVYHTLRLYNGDYAHAWGIIPYVEGNPSVDIDGPTWIQEGEGYTLEGKIYDASFVSPVTWQWSVDGVPAEGGRDLNWQAGEAGSVQQIDLQVTDGNGATHSAVHWVSAGACPPPQLQC